jgi:hypothetical protein
MGPCPQPGLIRRQFLSKRSQIKGRALEGADDPTAKHLKMLSLYALRGVPFLGVLRVESFRASPLQLGGLAKSVPTVSAPERRPWFRFSKNTIPASGNRLCPI